MSKSIAVIGTLDTRGQEIKYVSDLIKGRGHKCIVIDVGVLGEPAFEPTINKHHVAQAAETNLDELIALNSEAKAMAKMAEGVSNILEALYSNDKLSGVFAIGGTMGTSVALTIMKSVPIGVPKLILSTIAFSPLIPPDAITGDLEMMQWVAGLRGINSINRQVLYNAAGAIAGAAEMFHKKSIEKEKTVIGLTSLGYMPCRYAISWIEPVLREKGYAVGVFHVSGMGGRMFEQTVSQGLIDAVLDLELAEITNEVTGGITTAGEHRLEGAGKKGIPQIVAPTVDVVWWSPGQPLPKKFKNRPFREHN